MISGDLELIYGRYKSMLCNVIVDSLSYALPSGQRFFAKHLSGLCTGLGGLQWPTWPATAIFVFMATWLLACSTLGNGAKLPLPNPRMAPCLGSAAIQFMGGQVLDRGTILRFATNRLAQPLPFADTNRMSWPNNSSSFRHLQTTPTPEKHL